MFHQVVASISYSAFTKLLRCLLVNVAVVSLIKLGEAASYNFSTRAAIYDEISTESCKYLTEKNMGAHNFDFVPNFFPKWWFSSFKFCFFNDYF